MLRLGIVGLPNVGKSTLFNALTSAGALVANYPFATIEPNTGIVQVPDPRLDVLAGIVSPERTVPAIVEFVDIAGLVKGASEGQGLGNQFLANIRETSAIVHIVRAFPNPNITHVEANINPERDIEIINTELILKDLDTVAKKVKELEGKSKSDAKFKPVHEHFLKLQSHMSDEGKLAFDLETPNNDEIVKHRREMFLLSDKPVIYLVN